MSPQVSILEKIRAVHEEELLALEVSGSDLAAVMRFHTPWQLEQLGSPFADAKRLAKLEKQSLKSGSLANFTDKGGEFRWIRGRDKIKSLFLKNILSSDAGLWSEFLEAYRMYSEAIEEKRETSGVNETFKSECLTADGSSRSDWVRKGKWQVECLLGELNATAWKQSFVEGRILVFEEGRRGYRLRPPRHWADAPPFDLGMTEPAIQRKILEQRRTGIGPRDQSLRSPLLPHFTGTISLTKWSALSNSGTCAGLSDRYSFLLSGDLPEELWRPGALPLLRAGLTAKLNAQRWFREQVRSLMSERRRPSKDDAVDALMQRFSLEIGHAEGIWDVQRPVKWGRTGRIPKLERYFFP